MGKVLSIDAIRKLALAFYTKEAKLDPSAVSRGILPAKAKKAIGPKAGRPVVSIVDPVYFRENGTRNPLPASAAKSARALATAIRKRRDAGGTLGRWESVAASASATLGRPVSEAAARVLYAKGGGDLAASYVGRGTRKAAPKTYEAAVEVEATLPKEVG